MKLRKLTLHNIASMADAEIDFDKSPITDAGIFLIAGPTGAGKSTILDGIVLALYGNAPRFDRASGSADLELKPTDARNILRHGCGEGYVALTFRGTNGKEYRAEWKVRRARNKSTGKIMRAEHTLERLDDGTTFFRRAEVSCEISEAVGLDYQQFCRTVMLPQGEFTRFLFAKDADKAALLEKITRVDIYTRLGAAIYKRAMVHQEAYNVARRMVDETQGLSAEEEQSVRETLEEATKSEDAAARLLRILEARNNKEKNIERAAEAVEAGREEMRAAAQKAASEEMARHRILVERWSRSAEARVALATADRAAVAVNDCSRRMEALSGEVAFFEAAAKQLAVNVAEMEREVIELRKRVEISEERRNILTLGATIVSEHAAVEEGNGMLSRSRDIISGHRKEMERLRALASKLAVQYKDAEKIMAEKTAVFESLKDSVNKFAVAMRASLVEGCKCPVCRQTVKELPQAEDILRDTALRAKKESDDAVAAANDVASELRRAEAELKGLCEKILPAAEALAEQQSRALGSHRAALENALEPLRRNGYLHPGENIGAVGERLKKENETLAAESMRLEKLRGALNAKRESLANALEALGKIREVGAGYIKPAIAGNKPRHTIAALLADTTALASTIASAEKEGAAARGVVALFLSNRDNDYSENEMRSLSAYTHKDIMEISRRLQAADNGLTTSRKVLAERLLALRKAMHQPVDNLPAEMDGKDYEELRTEIAATLDKARVAVVESRSKLMQSEASRALRDERAKEAMRLKAVADRWESLNRVFGSADGDKFRRIAQSLILSSLVDSANRYMSTLAPRYRLKVVPGTFSILVEDSYQGYASRPVSTVSGGESFLVSLALALALSDIGSTLSVDTIFIDEGFGSLSGDALEYALSTLVELRRRNNRRVGVISHVPALRDRIDVQIEVTPSGIK